MNDGGSNLFAMHDPNQQPRNTLLIGLVAVGGLVAAGGLYSLTGKLAVRSDLQSRGYSDVEVHMNGPVTYGFSARKGSSSCLGTVTRVPMSTRTEELCMDTAPPAAPPPPKRTNRQEIEKSLERSYAKLGFEQFVCPEINGTDKSATCTVSATNGVKVAVTVEPTKVDGSGWQEWTTALDKSVAKGEKLAADLTPEINKAVGAKQPGVELAVDCGKGPVVFTDGKLTCEATTKAGKAAKVLLTLDKDGGYKWTVQGL